MKLLNRFLFILILPLVCFGKPQSSSNAKPRMLGDLTIIISSCDKYHDCRKPCLDLLFKYWPELKPAKTPIILITNNRPFSYLGVDVHQTGVDHGWSANMIEVLKKVKTRYVLYLQEDYFMTRPVNHKKLAYFVQKMKEQQIPYIQLNDDPYFEKALPFSGIINTAIKDKHTDWRTSLQASLWEKDVFLWLLKPTESAWDFEGNSSIRSEGIMRPFLIERGAYAFDYLNACGLGFMHQESINFLKIHGIHIGSVSLPIDADYKFTLWLRNFSNQPVIRKLNLYRNWLKIMGLWDPKFSKKS